MTYHSNDDQYRGDVEDLGKETADRIRILQAASRLHDDGLRVVAVQCRKCGRWYEESLYVAVMDVIANCGHCCIKCDTMADVRPDMGGGLVGSFINIVLGL